MQNSTLKKLIMNGLMIALVFLATYFTRIPTMILPGGYFNLGDAVIILAAFLLGPTGGSIAGAADRRWRILPQRHCCLRL